MIPRYPLERALVLNTLSGIGRAALIAGLLCAASPCMAGPDQTLESKAPESKAPESKAPESKAPESKAAVKVTRQAEPSPRWNDYLAGRAAQLDHDWRNAGPLLRRAWEADKDDATLRHDALLLSLTGGDFAGAVQIARAIPADSSDAALAGFILTLDDFNEGRYAAAEARLTVAPEHGLDRYATPLLTAWCEVGRGRKAEAIAALAKLDSLDGITELRALQSAMIMEALGDRSQAEMFYNKLLDAKPSPWAVTMVARFLERQGETEKARAVIERLDPDGPSSSLRTQLLAHLSEKSRPPAPDPRFGVAELLFEISASLESQQQSPDIASLLYVQLALHIRPTFPSALILLSRFDQRWGHIDDAVGDLLAVDEKSELRPVAEQLAIVALSKAGQGDRAIKLGQAAIKAHPEDSDLELTLAEILRANARYPEAIAAYDQVLARLPPASARRGLILFHRGIAFQQGHQWPRAEADLLAALQLRPDDPSLLNYLAFSWADQGVNLDRARTMLERAIQLVPDDGAFIDSLGWVMYRAGDYEDAVKQLEHAVALDAGDAEINDHLGDAYWKVGRLIEARGQWEKAARLSDDKALTEKIRVKLKDGLDPSAPRHASAD
jgi:tetratricopeptide (TPR) repeat protein